MSFTLFSNTTRRIRARAKAEGPREAGEHDLWMGAYSPPRTGLRTPMPLSATGRRCPRAPRTDDEWVVRNGRRHLRCQVARSIRQERRERKHAATGGPPPPHCIPYPLDYAPETLASHALGLLLSPAVPEEPRRCLDLGCGGGEWIRAALSRWPSCHFVGMDIVLLHRAQRHSTRVTWLKGDFLARLPFASASFDHVRVSAIDRAVPAHAWPALLAEIARVLQPSGTLAMTADDIIFPILPRSATARSQPSPSRATLSDGEGSVRAIGRILRPRRFTAGSPDDRAALGLGVPSIAMSALSLRSDGPAASAVSLHPSLSGPLSPPLTPPRTELIVHDDPIRPPLGHDYELLEDLFYAVYARREIPLDPTHALPALVHATGAFSLQLHDPVLVPMPPLARQAPPTPEMSPKSGLGPTHLAANHAALHLKYVLQGILAVREAMWEELVIRRNLSDSPDDRVRLERTLFENTLASYAKAIQALVDVPAKLVDSVGWRRPVPREHTLEQKWLSSESQKLRDEWATREAIHGLAGYSTYSRRTRTIIAIKA